MNLPEANPIKSRRPIWDKADPKRQYRCQCLHFNKVIQASHTKPAINPITAPFFLYFEDEFHEYLKGLPMLQSQRERVERAISDMIDEMYKTHLRRMQSDMHYCAARCCEDRRGTLDSVQVCIEDCAVPLIKAQDYLAHELGQFQGRLQNCVMQCNDDVSRQIPSSPKETELNRYKYQFERCTVACVDRHIGLIPSMMKTIKAVLAKGPDGTRQA